MAKSFQDRIIELQEYRPDIMYKDGAFILKIRFNKNWRIIQPKDDSVAYSKDEGIADMHWFVSTIEDSDKVFDLVDETILVNKEYEKKANLYKEKVKELQSLFLSDIGYDRLKLIRFVMEDKETKPKGKKAQSKSTKSAKPKEKAAASSNRQPSLPPVEPAAVEADAKEDGHKAEEVYSGDIDAIIEQAIG